MPGRSIPGSRTVVAYGWPGGRVRIIDPVDVGRFVIGFVGIRGKEGWFVFFGPNTPPGGPFSSMQAAIAHARSYA